MIADRRAPVTPTHRDPEARPWDRFDREPAMWFERFARFRRLGPKRSVRQAYLDEWKEAHGWTRVEGELRPPDDAPKLPVTVPQSWWVHVDQWRWRARADAWDVQQETDRSEAEMQVIRSEREMRIRIIKSARSKLVRALEQLQPSAFRPGEILMGIKIVHEELRKELGDDRKRGDEDDNGGVTVHVVNLPTGTDLSHFARPPGQPPPAIAPPPPPSVDGEHRELAPDEPDTTEEA